MDASHKPAAHRADTGASFNSTVTVNPPSTSSDSSSDTKTATRSRKRAVEHKPSTSKTRRHAQTPSAQGPGDWTAQKREQFFDRIIEVGYKNADLSALATELGLNKLQLKNQLQSGRKGNFRDRAVRHIKGEDKKVES